MTSAVVGVNLLWLVPGVVGGSEEYTVRLLRSLDRVDPDDIEVKLYAQPALAEAYPDLVARFETITRPSLFANKLGRVAAEASWLRSVAGDDDLLHHAGSPALPTSRRPYVFTVHDLQPLDHPENFSRVKRTWLGKALPPSIQNAELVLCVSQFTADTVQRHFDLSPDRIRIVPHGHESVDAGIVDTEKDRQLRADFGRYFLLPAIAYPHKRHVDLVDALGKLASEFSDVSLVLTGGPGPESARLDDHIDSLGLGDRVHRLGRLPEDELDHLYRSATALAFPSMYEGFGNPPLEAMARGCPVVATTAGSIPEVVGDAALMVPPCSPIDLAGALRRILSEPDLVESLRAKGLDRARVFDWYPAGVALVDAYRDALA